ncbi:hypothetical protein ACFL2I_07795, partial [Candidatus Omnitrophota bacterium]
HGFVDRIRKAEYPFISVAKEIERLRAEKDENVGRVDQLGQDFPGLLPYGTLVADMNEMIKFISEGDGNAEEFLGILKQLDDSKGQAKKEDKTERAKGSETSALFILGFTLTDILGSFLLFALVVLVASELSKRKYTHSYCPYLSNSEEGKGDCPWLRGRKVGTTGMDWYCERPDNAQCPYELRQIGQAERANNIEEGTQARGAFFFGLPLFVLVAATLMVSWLLSQKLRLAEPKAQVIAAAGNKGIGTEFKLPDKCPLEMFYADYNDRATWRPTFRMPVLYVKRGFITKNVAKGVGKGVLVEIDQRLKNKIERIYQKAYGKDYDNSEIPYLTGSHNTKRYVAIVVERGKHAPETIKHEVTEFALRKVDQLRELDEKTADRYHQWALEEAECVTIGDLVVQIEIDTSGFESAEVIATIVRAQTEAIAGLDQRTCQEIATAVKGRLRGVDPFLARSISEEVEPGGLYLALLNLRTRERRSSERNVLFGAARNLARRVERNERKIRRLQGIAASIKSLRPVGQPQSALDQMIRQEETQRRISLIRRSSPYAQMSIKLRHGQQMNSIERGTFFGLHGKSRSIKGKMRNKYGEVVNSLRDGEPSQANSYLQLDVYYLKQGWKQRIVRAIKIRQVKFSEIYTALGVGANTLNNWLDPDKSIVPSFNNWFYLAHVLGVSVVYLLTGMNEPDWEAIRGEFYYSGRAAIAFSSVNFSDEIDNLFLAMRRLKPAEKPLTPKTASILILPLGLVWAEASIVVWMAVVVGAGLALVILVHILGRLWISLRALRVRSPSALMTVNPQLPPVSGVIFIKDINRGRRRFKRLDPNVVKAYREINKHGIPNVKIPVAQKRPLKWRVFKVPHGRLLEKEQPFHWLVFGGKLGDCIYAQAKYIIKKFIESEEKEPLTYITLPLSLMDAEGLEIEKDKLPEYFAEYLQTQLSNAHQNIQLLIRKDGKESRVINPSAQRTVVLNFITAKKDIVLFKPIPSETADPACPVPGQGMPTEEKIKAEIAKHRAKEASVWAEVNLASAFIAQDSGTDKKIRLWMAIQLKQFAESSLGGIWQAPYKGFLAAHRDVVTTRSGAAQTQIYLSNNPEYEDYRDTLDKRAAILVWEIGAVRGFDEPANAARVERFREWYQHKSLDSTSVQSVLPLAVIWLAPSVLLCLLALAVLALQYTNAWQVAINRLWVHFSVCFWDTSPIDWRSGLEDMPTRDISYDDLGPDDFPAAFSNLQYVEIRASDTDLRNINRNGGDPIRGISAGGAVGGDRFIKDNLMYLCESTGFQNLDVLIVGPSDQEILALLNTGLEINKIYLVDANPFVFFKIDEYIKINVEQEENNIIIPQIWGYHVKASKIQPEIKRGKVQVAIVNGVIVDLIMGEVQRREIWECVINYLVSGGLLMSGGKFILSELRDGDPMIRIETDVENLKLFKRKGSDAESQAQMTQCVALPLLALVWVQDARTNTLILMTVALALFMLAIAHKQKLLRLAGNRFETVREGNHARGAFLSGRQQPADLAGDTFPFGPSSASRLIREQVLTLGLGLPAVLAKRDQLHSEANTQCISPSGATDPRDEKQNEIIRDLPNETAKKVLTVNRRMFSGYNAYLRLLVREWAQNGIFLLWWESLRHKTYESLDAALIIAAQHKSLKLIRKEESIARVQKEKAKLESLDLLDQPRSVVDKMIFQEENDRRLCLIRRSSPYAQMLIKLRYEEQMSSLEMGTFLGLLGKEKSRAHKMRTRYGEVVKSLRKGSPSQASTYLKPEYYYLASEWKQRIIGVIEVLEAKVSEVDKALGGTSSYLNTWLDPDKSIIPSFNNWFQLAHVLGVSVVYLLTGLNKPDWEDIRGEFDYRGCKEAIDFSSVDFSDDVNELFLAMLELRLAEESPSPAKTSAFFLNCSSLNLGLTNFS